MATEFNNNCVNVIKMFLWSSPLHPLYRTYQFNRNSLCAYCNDSPCLQRLANLFGVSEDVFLKCTNIVMDALVGNLHQIIRWPDPTEFEEYATKFDEIGRYFPNVIGAIDGLHIEIELTEERRFEPSFINYKQFHSMHLQVRFSYLRIDCTLPYFNTWVTFASKSLGCGYLWLEIYSRFRWMAWTFCGWIRFETKPFV